MSELAVQGCTLQISSTAGDITAVSVQPSNAPSSDVLISNKGVFFDKITAQITTAKISASIPGTTGTGILASGSVDINGTASNVLELPSNNKAVQKNDSGTKTLSFTFTTTTTPPSTTDVPLPVTVKVSDAGQTDVTAS